MMENSSSHSEPQASVDEFARVVIGAAIEVHRTLGPGFLEGVYEEALAIEMGLRGVPFARQLRVPVTYNGHSVGMGVIDFLIAGALVVELKTVEALTMTHKAQVISYLKATGNHLGLLINFNVPMLKDGLQRVVMSSA